MSANPHWALRHSIGVTIGFLVVASVALTFGYACAAPLAAFAAISALLFDSKYAVLSIVSVWAAFAVFAGYRAVGLRTAFGRAFAGSLLPHHA